MILSLQNFDLNKKGMGEIHSKLARLGCDQISPNRSEICSVVIIQDYSPLNPLLVSIVRLLLSKELIQFERIHKLTDLHYSNVPSMLKQSSLSI